QQNGVAERRNRTLIEAARTMLADAKLPRTKRVEENLHVDFLENKPIEKGAGLNWLFDIDSLTNSMNYVPVVVAAYMESSTSNAQGACSADAPESSGNFNPTLTSTNPPTGHIETLTVETLIPTVLKNKKDERGIVIRNKARIVAQGHTQEEGINYDEVFAPVARIEAIRLFLAYASFMGFTVYQMDVKSTFLYGTIDEEVYVMQPLGFQDPEFLARVYKVEKAIEFKAVMHEKFQMSAMGELNFFLGLQVLQKKDGIFLSEDKYIGDILKKFGYSDVRSSNTPMDKENPWGKDRTRKM
nr:hypothetical protein [Tanacetum cinerariifolium]